MPTPARQTWCDPAPRVAAPAGQRSWQDRVDRVVDARPDPLAPVSVALLLTDVAGSTRLWEADPAAMGVALARHDALGVEQVAAAGGRGIPPPREGDSTFPPFDDPPPALAAPPAPQPP